jgi:hypothetical protein
MLDQAALYEGGRIDLAGLVRDLRGLYVEADPHDVTLRDGFERHWTALDALEELRTEGWAPAGAFRESDVISALDALRNWIVAEPLSAIGLDHD